MEGGPISRPTLLAIVAIPAAVIGYVIGGAIVSALPLPDGLRDTLLLFIPLLVGGLFALPFLLPFFDRMARRDLEAYRAQQAGTEAGPSDPDTSG